MKKLAGVLSIFTVFSLAAPAPGLIQLFGGDSQGFSGYSGYVYGLVFPSEDPRIGEIGRFFQRHDFSGGGYFKGEGEEMVYYQICPFLTEEDKSSFRNDPLLFVKDLAYHLKMKLDEEKNGRNCYIYNNLDEIVMDIFFKNNWEDLYNNNGKLYYRDRHFSGCGTTHLV